MMAIWSDLVAAWTALGPTAKVAMAGWVLATIALPIARWTWNERALPWSVTAGVVLQAATVLAVLGPAWGWRKTTVVALAIGGVVLMSQRAQVMRLGRRAALARAEAGRVNAAIARLQLRIARLKAAGQLAELAERYDVSARRIEEDMEKLVQGLSLLLQDRADCAPAVKTTPFGSHERKYPVLSEIALTYRCQNRCFFCYASSPDRGPQVPEMTTDKVKLVLDKIVNQARVPTVSFTGGEPTKA